MVVVVVVVVAVVVAVEVMYSDPFTALRARLNIRVRCHLRPRGKRSHGRRKSNKSERHLQEARGQTDRHGNLKTETRTILVKARPGLRSWRCGCFRPVSNCFRLFLAMRNT